MRLISSNPSLRNTLNVETLVFWGDPNWHHWVTKFLSGYGFGEIITNFKNNDLSESQITTDSLNWFDKLVREETNLEVDSKIEVAVALRKQFKFLRAAHGTRTYNLEAFYDNGMQILSLEKIEIVAAELFACVYEGDSLEEAIRQAIASIEPKFTKSPREGRLYYCTDEDGIILDGAHYLKYGSEVLNAIGNRVIGSENTRSIMSKIGRATIFVCDIPMDLIPDQHLKEFAIEMIVQLFGERLQIQKILDCQEFCIFINDSLPPRYIVGHYHPAI